MTELIGRTLGNYSILDAVGQGGMATVYRAQDMRDRRVVAIKVLSAYIAADPKFRGRFDREVELLRRLDHPHIVPILAFGQADGNHYIVMPYLSGGTVHDRLRMGPLLPLEGGRIVEQISSALDFAHQQGIVHRDVKPSNILLDENGRAMLTDFGFAHVPWESASLTGSLLIGTPAYMSPEQCRGEDVGPASDQYSFGVVLYQLCTGHLPYEADTPMGVVIKQASQPLPAPRLANPNLPVAVEDVLIRVLSKEPADRFESVSALNQAFQGALKASLDPNGAYRRRQLRAEQPTETLPRTVVMRAWARETARRTRRFVPLLAAVILLGCPAAAWGFGVLPPLWNGSSSVLAQADGSAEFQATINALSTFNAPGEGTLGVPGAVETAVRGTIVAMGFPPPSLEAMTQQALLASGEATLDVTPSPSMMPFGSSTRTSTPTGGGGQQVPTVANPTAPAGATATDAPAPTNTPVPPADTPVPPPTDPPPPPTDPPINPDQCKYDMPEHPHYCTPSP